MVVFCGRAMHLTFNDHFALPGIFLLVECQKEI